MPNASKTLKIAVLDDYQGVALKVADWSQIGTRAEITVFRDHVADHDTLINRLAPFDVLCVMRERTPLPEGLLSRLPKLKFIASTGPYNSSIDVVTAAERGIAIAHTRYTSAPTIELTWALILSSARHVSSETASVRSDGWQISLGDDMAGRTLGVVGLGHVG